MSNKQNVEIIKLSNYLYSYGVLPWNNEPLMFDQYVVCISGVRNIWGKDIAAFLMDCFTPDGEPVELGYEDSLSHYYFDWNDFYNDVGSVI